MARSTDTPCLSILLMRLYGARRNGREQGDAGHAHDQRHDQHRPAQMKLVGLLEVGQRHPIAPCAKQDGQRPHAGEEQADMLRALGIEQPLLGLPSIRLCYCEDDVFLGRELF